MIKHIYIKFCFIFITFVRQVQELPTNYKTSYRIECSDYRSHTVSFNRYPVTNRKSNTNLNRVQLSLDDLIINYLTQK